MNEGIHGERTASAPHDRLTELVEQQTATSNRETHRNVRARLLNMGPPWTHGSMVHCRDPRGDPLGYAADILVRSNLMTWHAAIYFTQVEHDTIMVCCATPWFSFTCAAACEPKVYITDQRGRDLCPRRATIDLRRR
jgi:hypothetical protein